MPTLEAPQSAKVPDKPSDPVGEQTVASRAANGHGVNGHGATEVLQQCLDLAVTGNLAAGRTIRRFAETVDRVAPLDAVGPTRQRELIVAGLEMSRRVAHLPLEVGHTLVQSAVVVDVGVDVDVDIASQHQPASQIEERKGHD